MKRANKNVALWVVGGGVILLLALFFLTRHVNEGFQTVITGVKNVGTVPINYPTQNPSSSPPSSSPPSSSPPSSSPVAVCIQNFCKCQGSQQSACVNNCSNTPGNGKPCTTEKIEICNGELSNYGRTCTPCPSGKKIDIQTNKCK